MLEHLFAAQSLFGVRDQQLVDEIASFRFHLVRVDEGASSDLGKGLVLGVRVEGRQAGQQLVAKDAKTPAVK